MNLRQCLLAAREDPDTEYRVMAEPYSGMKGPKYIRWSEDDMEYQGKRNDDWSTLDKHWLVITQPGVEFEATSGRAMESETDKPMTTTSNADVSAALETLRRALTH